MKKKKILIVTINDFVVYQPTILNLYDHLIPEFDVEIVSIQPAFITKNRDESRNVVYLKPNPFVKWFLGKFDFGMSSLQKLVQLVIPGYKYEYKYYNNYLPSFVKNWLKRRRPKPDIVIAVDLPALAIAQDVYGDVEFLSLEVENRDSSNYGKIDVKKIRSIVIQSSERKDYLFPGGNVKTFIVQNAPVFDPGSIYTAERNDFVFAGTARKVFGIFECIEFIRGYPDARLIQKGGGEKKVLRRIRDENGDLIEMDRLVLDNSYLPAEEFISYLSRFRFGFCFYSWDLINNYFNYRTAPSGKLFMYMAAGIPVIASDIPGFKFVEQYEAGVLIRDYSPGTIRKAVEQMESNYQHYSNNCYRMAADLSFDRAIRPYIEYLRSGN